MAAAVAVGDVPPPDPPPTRAVDSDERGLVEQARTDRAAFGVLYRRHVAAVFAFTFKRCGSRDVAEEATSATFERALRAIDGYEWREGGIRPWLLRIASNEVAEIYRRRARVRGDRGQRALRLLTSDDQDHDAPVEGEAERQLVQHALDTLTERHRDVITLRLVLGLSPDETAAQLGLSKALVAVTLHRAVHTLRDAVESLREQPGGGAR